jgi:hypothetical protein
MAKTKTHIIEQDKNGNCFPVECVYLVRQTQPEEDYRNTTIYVFTDKRDATKEARKLNKEYGQGCIFNDKGDFVEVDYEDSYVDGVHYYDVEEIIINPIIKE